MKYFMLISLSLLFWVLLHFGILLYGFFVVSKDFVYQIGTSIHVFQAAAGVQAYSWAFHSDRDFIGRMRI